MRLLLDTQVFLWANASPERLGRLRPLVAGEEHELLLSAASSWEIAIKAGLGRLALPEPPARYVVDRARRLGVTLLAVEHRHALAVGELPPLHRDPFDRLLVAVAHDLECPVLSADPQVAAYGVEVLAP